MSDSDNKHARGGISPIDKKLTQNKTNNNHSHGHTNNAIWNLNKNKRRVYKLDVSTKKSKYCDNATKRNNKNTAPQSEERVRAKCVNCSSNKVKCTTMRKIRIPTLQPKNLGSCEVGELNSKDNWETERFVARQVIINLRSVMKYMRKSYKLKLE